VNIFTEEYPTLESYFRSVILFGKNSASYKFALAKSLIELSKNHKQNTFIPLEDLSIPFSKHICEHLKINDKQTTSRSSRFLDACRQFNNGEISHDELIHLTTKLGFVNVLDAFHVVNVKADDKIPNIAGIKFPTYNRTIVSTRGAMVHDYERGIFYDQRDV
jgi:hypothetical protein